MAIQEMGDRQWALRGSSKQISVMISSFIIHYVSWQVRSIGRDGDYSPKWSASQWHRWTLRRLSGLQFE